MKPSFGGAALGMASLLPSLLVGLQACSTVPGASSNGLPQSPLFPSEPQEIVRYEEAIHDRKDGQPGCEDIEACAEAHFTLALAALYRNQAEAASHFQTVVEEAPDTPEADASKVWLRLLSANAFVERPRLFPRATELLVRQYLSMGFRDRQRIKELEDKKQALKQELEARTRDVEKLTRQLEALKRIDREIEALRDKTRPSSSPTIPAPSGALEPK